MARRRSNSRRSGFIKPKKFIVVATEGFKTERIYLDEFKPPRDGTVQLKVLPNWNHKTSPRQVLKKLKEYRLVKKILGR